MNSVLTLKEMFIYRWSYLKEELYLSRVKNRKHNQIRKAEDLDSGDIKHINFPESNFI